ncbi:glycine zipper domain-containing protein [Novosphingobium sp. SL115]|uniref:YMGG-like glycine zipper-containing protein n=1 Tax=Novosphingobium sp. SL115 TaxID=2995150 RepID=UPI002274CFE1|nr:glycine zipper domain-containing protein [Novosphingobium sp. SL115]MCY1671625.1 glycine zipper domain-containing protein [Novosphingobium sp. SL115]
MRKIIIASLIMGSAVTLGGCARNYTGEGAALGAAVGAGIGAATGGDIATGAAIGGAVGAAGGSQIRKDGDRCYRRDRNGYEYEVRC